MRSTNSILSRDFSANPNDLLGSHVTAFHQVNRLGYMPFGAYLLRSKKVFGKADSLIARLVGNKVELSIVGEYDAPEKFAIPSFENTDSISRGHLFLANTLMDVKRLRIYKASISARGQKASTAQSQVVAKRYYPPAKKV